MAAGCQRVYPQRGGAGGFLYQHAVLHVPVDSHDSQSGYYLPAVPAEGGAGQRPAGSKTVILRFLRKRQKNTGKQGRSGHHNMLPL